MASSLRKAETDDRVLNSNGGAHRGYELCTLLDKKSMSETALRKFICVICNHILKYPRQTGCGHRACLECLEEYCEESNPECPACLEEEEENILSTKDCFEDKAIMRDMARLDCVCNNEYCLWAGKFPQFIVHERSCEFADKKSDSEKSDLEASETSDVTSDSDSEVEVLESPLSSGVASRGFQFEFQIDSFRSKLLRAQNGERRSIYSEPHLTGSPGYAVGACAYLNGDGMAKDRYMSMYLVIHKGIFDGKMPWPFNRRVTMELVNQDKKKSIKTSFTPDHTSSSFRRPTDDRNTPSGFPQFCPIGKLTDAKQGFVRDDTIHIRVTVGEQNVCTLSES